VGMAGGGAGLPPTRAPLLSGRVRNSVLVLEECLGRAPEVAGKEARGDTDGIARAWLERRGGTA
jgi:hypothetical protein